ncbi:hypothetical protein K488DRAFT_72711 [Vararia minispora EC-137]|uniref:Uncharacterized protein n=1 Tax=Vararia minispora EC-137 TaxID=1314806 RepID=A0ACB8QDI5_9AGAM|nr:hypothetical protein K488DRAFT_72711 [Vararia minispora EC-137]
MATGGGSKRPADDCFFAPSWKRPRLSNQAGCDAELHFSAGILFTCRAPRTPHPIPLSPSGTDASSFGSRLSSSSAPDLESAATATSTDIIERSAHQPGGHFENSIQELTGTGSISSVPDVINRSRGGVALRVLVPCMGDLTDPGSLSVEMMNRWYDFETAVPRLPDVETYLWNSDQRDRTILVLDNRSHSLFIRAMPCLTMRRNERALTIVALEAIDAAASVAGHSSSSGISGRFRLEDHTPNVTNFPELYTEELRLSIIYEWQGSMDLGQWTRRTCASKVLTDGMLDLLVDHTLDGHLYPPEYDFLLYRQALLHPNGMTSKDARANVLVACLATP